MKINAHIVVYQGQEQIIGMKPLPNIHEVFFQVRRKESRKRLMMGEVITGSTIEQNSPLAP